MQAGSWPNLPYPDEYAVWFDRNRTKRLLIVPALFDEGNKLRRFTVEAMRALDQTGVDCWLPDLPGTNESVQQLSDQTIVSWRSAMEQSASAFRATSVLTIRGGCLCSPKNLASAFYAPVSGSSILRGMLRAETIAEREAGRHTTRDDLAAQGRSDGVRLAAWDLSAEMFRALEDVEPAAPDHSIMQQELSGAGLWLRAEPGEDAQQSEALAEAAGNWLA